MLGVQIFFLFIFILLDEVVSIVFTCLLIASVYIPRVIAEVTFILMKYDEFVCDMCILARVVTVTIDGFLGFIHFILLLAVVDDSAAQGYGISVRFYIFLIIIPIDIYFGYIFYGYSIHSHLRYDRNFKGPDGKEFVIPQNVISDERDIDVQNVQNAAAHDQEVPGTLNHGENYQAEDQLAQIETHQIQIETHQIQVETHQIQDGSNNLASRSSKENDDKAIKDNDTNVAVQPMVDKDKQGEDPNIHNRRVDEEDL